MRKLLLLVAFAALSSAVFGQMTQVLSADHISMNGFEPIHGSRYVIAYTDSSALFYDPTDFHLVYTLNIPGAYSLSASCLPCGLYGNSSDDYAIVYCSFEIDPRNWVYWAELRIYKLDSSPMLIETLKSGYDGVESLFSMYKYGNNAFMLLGNSIEQYIGSHLFKFPNSVSPSSTSEPKADNSGMMAYPNPSRDKINLVYQAPEKATSVKVYDVNGRQVARIPVGSTSTECTLDVSNYPEGVYFYEINGKSQSFMVK